MIQIFLISMTSWHDSVIVTARKVSKYGVFSGPYFPAFVFSPNARKIRTRKISVIGHFSRSVLSKCLRIWILLICLFFFGCLFIMLRNNWRVKKNDVILIHKTRILLGLLISCNISLWKIHVHEEAVTSGKDIVCNRSSPPEVFFGNVALKICSKFTGEHPCRHVIFNKVVLQLMEGCFCV